MTLQKIPSKLIHGKEAYKIRELFLLSFDVGKSYWENLKLEEVKLYNQYSLESGNIFESNWGYMVSCIQEISLQIGEPQWYGRGWIL